MDQRRDERTAHEGAEGTSEQVERRLSLPQFPYTTSPASFDPRVTLQTGAGRVDRSAAFDPRGRLPPGTLAVAS